MKQFIREYFTFNKRERNGIVVLLTIIIVLITYLHTSHLFITHETVDFTKFEKEIEELNTASAKANNSSNYKNDSNNPSLKFNNQSIESTYSKPEYFIFNPNHLPANDWKKLGFSDKQISVIKNYETKGGKFLSKNDVKKMYCISEKQYLLIAPYIQIPTVEHKIQPSNNKATTTKSKIETIELNTADSLQLLSLKGIGPFYAKAIIKYKLQLGGYYDKEQLLELWKFDAEKLKNISTQLTVDTTYIKKININTCDAKQLKHPYLKWNEVNAIINYRNKHGKYQSVKEIKNTDLINDSTFQKITHYITVR